MSIYLKLKNTLIANNIHNNTHNSIVDAFYRKYINFQNIIDILILNNPCLMNRVQATRWILGNIKFRKCEVCGKRLDAKTSMRENAHFCSMACRKTPKGKQIWNAAKEKSLKEKYGVINVGQLQSVKDKSKATNLERYGVDNPAKRKEVREKMAQTTLERYGVKNISQHKERRAEVTRKIQEDGYNTVKKNLVKHSLCFNTSFEDYNGINQKNCKTNIYSLHCNKCGLDFDYRFNCGKNLAYACPHCFPSNRSHAEMEIFNFVSNICIDAKANDRMLLGNFHNPELDIYIPSKKLAIEYNGLYWHSESQGKDRRYHLDKTLACQEQGVQLIHIFSDEWENKQQIVKARLKHILGATKYKIYARKCSVDFVNNKLATKFLNKYHIQGAINAPINLGLFYKNRLVALMTFSKSRFNKSYDYELLRYCTISNFSIIGAAGKLFDHFLKNFSGSIISYVDRRWSNGNLYKQLGFVESGSSAPAYYYVKDGIRYNRVKFQKHKLYNLLEVFDPSLSETKNMEMNDYIRVWDCGTLTFIFK